MECNLSQGYVGYPLFCLCLVYLCMDSVCRHVCLGLVQFLEEFRIKCVVTYDVFETDYSEVMIWECKQLPEKLYTSKGSN